jgi:hypothetical protein
MLVLPISDVDSSIQLAVRVYQLVLVSRVQIATIRYRLPIVVLDHRKNTK